MSEPVNEKAWPLEFERALADDDPVESLRQVVASAVRAGADRNTTQAQLDSLRAHLRQAGREDDEDTVLDVLDFLTGWSSPHKRI